MKRVMMMMFIGTETLVTQLVPTSPFNPKKADALEHEANRLATLKNYSLIDRIQTESDPEKRAAMERIIRLEKANELDPEKLLAASIIDGRGASDALQQHYAATGVQIDMQRVQALTDENLDTYRKSFTELFRALAKAVKD